MVCPLLRRDAHPLGRRISIVRRPAWPTWVRWTRASLPPMLSSGPRSARHPARVLGERESRIVNRCCPYLGSIIRSPATLPWSPPEARAGSGKSPRPAPLRGLANHAYSDIKVITLERPLPIGNLLGIDAELVGVIFCRDLLVEQRLAHPRSGHMKTRHAVDGVDR